MIIAGVVTDPSGHPVAGASVLIAAALVPVRSEVDLVEVTVHVAAGEAQVAVALSG